MKIAIIGAGIGGLTLAFADWRDALFLGIVVTTTVLAAHLPPLGQDRRVGRVGDEGRQREGVDLLGVPEVDDRRRAELPPSLLIGQAMQARGAEELAAADEAAVWLRLFSKMLNRRAPKASSSRRANASF